MKLVMIGGHTRNIGKTSVVEGIISALPEMNWTAVKITQFGHGVCSINGESCGCEVTEHQFDITEEQKKSSDTDTARFLLAGAHRSLWVRTKQGELAMALPSLRKEIENDQFVIAESNSLRRFLNPTIYLQVLDPLNLDFKPSAQQFLDLSDAFIIVSRSGNIPVWENVSVAKELQKKPNFFVSAKERYINPSIVEFVRSRLISY